MKNFKELEAALDQCDLLDDLVHDLKSNEGSSVNNGGAVAQIAYIREAMGDEAARVQLDAIASNWTKN